MAARKALRVATTADAPVRSKSITEAANRGTVRELLAATRDRIAVAVENPNTPARDLAALTKRLMEVVREIESIDARKEQDGDEDSRSAVEDGTFNASAV